MYYYITSYLEVWNFIKMCFSLISWPYIDIIPTNSTCNSCLYYLVIINQGLIQLTLTIHYEFNTWIFSTNFQTHRSTQLFTSHTSNSHQTYSFQPYFHIPTFLYIADKHFTHLTTIAWLRDNLFSIATTAIYVANQNTLAHIIVHCEGKACVVGVKAEERRGTVKSLERNSPLWGLVPHKWGY